MVDYEINTGVRYPGVITMKHDIEVSYRQASKNADVEKITEKNLVHLVNETQ